MCQVEAHEAHNLCICLPEGDEEGLKVHALAARADLIEAAASHSRGKSPVDTGHRFHGYCCRSAVAPSSPHTPGHWEQQNDGCWQIVASVVHEALTKSSGSAY